MAKGKAKPKAAKVPLKSYTIKDGAENTRKTVVATKAIKQGSVLLTEAPIMYVKTISDENILTVFNGLDQKEKEQVLSMVPAKSNRKDDEDQTKVLDMFQRKNINHKAEGQALYYVLSRIRHSCAPNIALIPLLESSYGSIEVRACRAIKKGEDLCADYLPAINTFEPKAVRSAIFGDKFVCDCEVCIREDKALEDNERIRASIKEHYRNTTICVTLGNFVGGFDACRSMLQSMMEIEEECVLKIISVTLECWQLAVLAQLQDPALEGFEISKWKSDSLRLCKILGKCEVDKWKATEQWIANQSFNEFDTIKLRAKGPWAFQYIQKLVEENRNTVGSLSEAVEKTVA